mgnify:CR=1 FL=1
MSEPRYNVETLEDLTGLRDARPGDVAVVANVPKRSGPVHMRLEHHRVIGAMWEEDPSLTAQEALSAP